MIPRDSIIDQCPVLILDQAENKKHIELTTLYHYTYNWPSKDTNGKPLKTQAVVLGLGSMFNHSHQHQNVGWTRNLEDEVITYRALRDILVDEELCISYGDHLTFEDVDRVSGDTTADTEDANELLGRIDLT